MHRRKGAVIMLKLLGLLKNLRAVMLVTIITGTLGYLSSLSIMIMAVTAVIKFAGYQISLSYGAIFAIMMTFGVMRGLLRFVEHYSGHYTAFKLLAVFRDKVFLKLRELSPAKLEVKEKGKLIAVITSDIETLEVFYAHTIAPIVIAILHSVIVAAFVWIVSSYILALVALAAYLVTGLVLPILFGGKIKVSGVKYRESYSALSAYFVDNAYGVSELNQYNKTESVVSRLKQRSADTEKENKYMKSTSSKYRGIADLSMYIFNIIMICAGALLFSLGIIDIPGLFLSAVALISSYGPTLALSALPGSLTQTLAAGDRVLNLLEEQPVVGDVAGMDDIEYQNVSLENVYFNYGDNPVVKGVNLQLERGKIYGISGESGCGKSTLLKLLMRFWQPQSGKIYYNGKDIDTINTASLRKNISYVTQDTYIFNFSIKDNIKVAGQDMDDSHVKTAAEQASLWEFISSLDDGLDTPAGSLGDRLSGGEKQRIGIARAFMYDADLVLLDEPTSNVDSINEAVILNSIKQYKQGRTIVLVSHRESTLKICDEVYNMKNGVLKKRSA